MALLTLTPPPGVYTQPTTVTASGEASISGVIMTTDGSDPVVVRTVCSTNKFAPTEYPYVQTIEDGRGRAVFDGSFPKYYNIRWTEQGSPTTFAGLNQNFKFLYNVLNFLRGTGTRLLVLGDHYAGDGGPNPTNYLVKANAATAANGFATSFQGIAALMGLTITIKDGSDYSGGALNPTYSECMNYDVILFLSSGYSTPGLLTSSGASNIAQARRDGVGLYICTDNGAVAMNTSTRSPQGFYETANFLLESITVANFQGNFDFSPGTTVAYNVAAHGTSPLFNNLSASDTMTASDSDSYVNQAVVNPSALPVTFTAPEGYTTVKFAILLSDGSIEYEQYGYNVGQPPLVVQCDSSGNELSTGWTQTNLHTRSVYFKYIPGSFGDGSGFIMVNGVVVGEFNDVVGGLIPVTWLNTEYTPSTNNSIFMPASDEYDVSVSVTVPIVFDFTFPFNRFIPAIPPTRGGLGTFVSLINRNEFKGNTAAQVLQTGKQLLGATPARSDPSSVSMSVFTKMTT